MKYLLINLILFIGGFGFHLTTLAQSESFDLVSYSPPRDSAGTVKNLRSLLLLYKRITNTVV